MNIYWRSTVFKKIYYLFLKQFQYFFFHSKSFFSFITFSSFRKKEQSRSRNDRIENNTIFSNIFVFCFYHWLFCLLFLTGKWPQKNLAKKKKRFFFYESEWVDYCCDFFKSKKRTIRQLLENFLWRLMSNVRSQNLQKIKIFLTNLI